MGREQLVEGWKAMAEGRIADAASIVEECKELPRLEDGLFDLTEIDNNCYRSARWVYPLYAGYETELNKKEGYPDIMAQIRAMNEKLKQDYTFANCAEFMDMLIHTIDHISIELYEYYRELVDMFRSNVKQILGQYGTENGGFQAEQAGSETVTWNGEVVTSEVLLRAAIKHACETEVLLTEKYQVFC